MSSWNSNLSQDQYMMKDQCILVDMKDQIIGSQSKKQAHVFEEKHVRGQLHRAFSVFLFDDKGRLLLQKRAKSKITFPNVWTNTCCSHPLHGQEPSEIDKTVSKGQAPGVVNAAFRKLKQELNIDAKDLPPKKEFKFLTRLHYWAADVVTHGVDSPWGEHEIDYVLFARVSEIPSLKPNPDEVDDVCWVTKEELVKMMKPTSGLLWSPWFRILTTRFLLPKWWKDLDVTMNTDRHVDVNTIYRFDPTKEHMGGKGKAGPWLDLMVSSNESK